MNKTKYNILDTIEDFMLRSLSSLLRRLQLPKLDIFNEIIFRSNFMYAC